MHVDLYTCTLYKCCINKKVAQHTGYCLGALYLERQVKALDFEMTYAPAPACYRAKNDFSG